jgi:single-strand DNA-binding protein
MARSLNRAQLIGNLTRDPELRYTPNGTAVCSFGLATNRSWKTDAGERHDEAEFHNIVAWNKLAELCSQFLVKGRKVYVEGRLSTRTWTGQDGAQRNRTEIVISDMILLDSNRGTVGVTAPEEPAAEEAAKEIKKTVEIKETGKKKETASKEVLVKAKKETVAEPPAEEVVPDDIPF